MIKHIGTIGIVAVLVLLLSCTNQEQTTEPTSIPGSPGERAEGSVDCGSVEKVSPEDLRKVVLDSGDLAGELRPFPAGPVTLDDVGDEYFRASVDPSKYVGGFATAFGSGDLSEGGPGRLVTSIVTAFTDDDAAAMLLNHPDPGEPSVDRSVETPRFGDASDSRYVEVPTDGGKLAGHIIQFRAGRLVAYIANIAADGDASLGETERLARLVCDRIRQHLTGGAIAATPLSTATASETVTSDGAYQQFLSTRQRFEIDVPRDWLPVPDFPLEYEGGEILADAFEGPPYGGVGPRAVVFGVPTLGLTPEQTYARELAWLLQNYEDARVEDLLLAGHEAKLCVFEVPPTLEEPSVDASQIHVVIGDTHWTLTFMAPVGQRDKYLPVFQHMWESFIPE